MILSDMKYKIGDIIKFEPMSIRGYKTYYHDSLWIIMEIKNMKFKNFYLVRPLNHRAHKIFSLDCHFVYKNFYYQFFYWINKSDRISVI